MAASTMAEAAKALKVAEAAYRRNGI